MEYFTLDQQVFNLMHGATNDRLIDPPREPNMEGGAILSPVLQGHHKRVRKREGSRPSWFHFLLRLFSQDLQHSLAGLGMDTAGTLEVPWRHVFHVLVGHGIPSCDLLLAAFFDLCKRSNGMASGAGSMQWQPACGRSIPRVFARCRCAGAMGKRSPIGCSPRWCGSNAMAASAW